MYTSERRVLEARTCQYWTVRVVERRRQRGRLDVDDRTLRCARRPAAAAVQLNVVGGCRRRRRWTDLTTLNGRQRLRRYHRRRRLRFQAHRQRYIIAHRRACTLQSLRSRKLRPLWLAAWCSG